MRDKKHTVKQFRKPIPSPQPWKLEVPKPLDLEEEFNPSDDDTQEFYICDPDDFFDENEPTSKFTVPIPLVRKT